MANTKYSARKIQREELIRYLSERGKLSYVFDNIEKLEDLTQVLDAVEVNRLNSANSSRLSLLKKYLPDLKAVEVTGDYGDAIRVELRTLADFYKDVEKGKAN